MESEMKQCKQLIATEEKKEKSKIEPKQNYSQDHLIV